MSKWLVIVFESKTEDDSVVKRAIRAAGGQIVWSGDRRPLVVVQQPEGKRSLEADPRLSKPL